MRIMVTGNRPKSLGNAYELSHPLNKRMSELIRAFITSRSTNADKVELIHGGALGADTIFALSALQLRKEEPAKYSVEAAIPCINQDAAWNNASKKLYQGILAACDKVTYVTTEAYGSGCMEKRNHYMVNLMEETDYILAIWSENLGGTYECIRYALERGKKVYVINPMDNWKKYMLDPKQHLDYIKAMAQDKPTKKQEKVNSMINPNDLAVLLEEKTKPVAAPPTCNKELTIYTSSIRYGGANKLDISIKSGDKTFAPNWEMVNGIKKGLINMEQYTQMYYYMMRQSYNTNFERWKEVLLSGTVVLCCYCNADEFCHRHLLVDILTKTAAYYGIKVTYGGEIA